MLSFISGINNYMPTLQIYPSSNFQCGYWGQILLLIPGIAFLISKDVFFNLIFVFSYVLMLSTQGSLWIILGSDFVLT